MAVHEKTLEEARLARQREPQALGMIERIFYFEHQDGPAADNDNKHAARAHASACFNSWAMPDFMRK